MLLLMGTLLAGASENTGTAGSLEDQNMWPRDRAPRRTGRGTGWGWGRTRRSSFLHGACPVRHTKRSQQSFGLRRSASLGLWDKTHAPRMPVSTPCPKSPVFFSRQNIRTLSDGPERKIVREEG